MSKNMLDSISEIASEKIAAIDESGALSYGDLIERATTRFKGLNSERQLIVLECDATVDWLISYVGLVLADHVIILVPKDSDAFIQAIVDDFNPNAIVKLDGSINTVNSQVLAMHNDLSLMLSTSGSTGSPKCVKLSHQNISSNAKAIVQYLKITENDRGVVNLPTNYSYGLSIVNSHLIAGATCLFNSDSIIDTAFWDFCTQHKITSFAGVPHNYELLSKLNYEKLIPKSVRYFTQAGGKLAKSKVIEFAQFARSHSLEFFIMYGQTEAAPRMAFLPPKLTLEYPDAIGIPVPGGELQILNSNGDEALIEQEGELVYRGPNVMMGYATQLSELITEKNTFELFTGDIARKSANGLYYITGRQSRFIKIFGNRISLDQVEVVCHQHKFDVIATGLDETLFIVCTSKTQIKDLSTFILEKLQLPKSAVRVAYRPEFPVLETGKFNYNALKKELEGELSTVTTSPDSSVKSIFVGVFGEDANNETNSFFDLGGDSLTFVSISIELEELIGELPEDWTKQPIATLAKIPNKNASLEKHETKTKSRLNNIETLRAIACILVVAYHVVGSDPSYGLGIAMDSPFRSIFDVFDLIRMPLFTALAGLMFIAMLPRNFHLKELCVSKLTSLVLPAIAVSIIFFAIRTAINRENGELTTALLFGYLHLWYLYSLFWITIVIGGLHILLKPNFTQYILLAVFSFIAALAIDANLPFAIKPALQLAPFFILGILLFQHTSNFLNRKFLMLFSGIAIIAVLIRVLSFFDILDRSFVVTYLSIISSLSLVIVCFVYFPKLKWLSWIGVYSYAIYLWHPLASSLTRMILFKLEMDYTPLLFMVILFIGIVIPVVLYKISYFTLPKLIRIALIGR